MDSKIEKIAQELVEKFQYSLDKSKEKYNYFLTDGGALSVAIKSIIIYNIRI